MIRAKPDEKEAIKRVQNNRLKEVLDRGSGDAIDNLKLASEFGNIRFHQGYIAAVEDIIKLLSPK